MNWPWEMMPCDYNGKTLEWRSVVNLRNESGSTRTSGLRVAGTPMPGIVKVNLWSASYVSIFVKSEMLESWRKR